jgi:hypothetical protein
MHHIIKKQIFDLKVDPRLDSFHIQQIISRQYRAPITESL